MLLFQSIRQCVGNTLIPSPRQPTSESAQSIAPARMDSDERNSPQNSAPTRPKGSLLAQRMRALAAKIGGSSTASVATEAPPARQTSQRRSAMELVQQFDTLHSFDKTPAPLKMYMRRHAEQVRTWLHDVSQPVPIIACDYLNTSAIADLHAIVRRESYRRERIFFNSGASLGSLNDIFMEGADVDALHEQEKGLALLLKTRTPVDETSTSRLEKLYAERTALSHKILHAESPGTPATQDASNDEQPGGRSQAKRFRQIDDAIHQLTTEIRRDDRNTARRTAEIKAYRHSMFRAFKDARAEAADRLMPLPRFRTPIHL